MSYSISEHIRTYACITVYQTLQLLYSIAVQPLLISALVMYMGVCMQLGDVYMGRCTAGIGMQS